MILLTLTIIIVVLLIAVISIYNTLVRQRNQVKEGWSGIDVQLKRRYDLIPNLVSTVQAYAGHEAKVFQDVTELRSKVGQAQGIQEKAQLESALSLGLSKLIAVAEQYPDLQANQNFIQLQNELSAIEDQIQMARRYYNGTARDYNSYIESFPQLFIAQFFHFTPFEYFEASSDEERQVPKVAFQ